MPKMNGKYVALELSKHPHLKKVPTVVFTTSNNSMDRMFFERLSINFFTKPMKHQEYVGTIAHLLSYCKQ
ncbi:MAG: hypothetical protein C4329_14960 [Chitinophagaceae bacterium]